MKRALLSLLLICAPAALLPASYDLDRILLEMENREKTLDAIRFDFQQQIHFTQLNNDSLITGEALFGKRGQLRITKSTPDKQVTVSDGKKVWVFNPQANQVWQGSSKKWLQSPVLPKGMVPLNNYVDDLKRNFDLQLKESSVDSSDIVTIKAEPRSKALGYEIELRIATATWLPVQTIYRSDSAKVVTTLSKTQVNPNVQESDFRFKVPKGTDVIPFN